MTETGAGAGFAPPDVELKPLPRRKRDELSTGGISKAGETAAGGTFLRIGVGGGVRGAAVTAAGLGIGKTFSGGGVKGAGVPAGSSS